MTPTALLLACTLAAPCQIHVSKAEPLVLHIMDTAGRELRTATITAGARYTVGMSRVYCLNRALWATPLPVTPVRLVLQCKARYSGYWFGTDNSYRDSTGAHWVKVWDKDSLDRKPKRTYIVDAEVPMVEGQITLTGCKEVER